jgi:putative DNA primase/helicase
MKRHETSSDVEHNALMEESVFLRIQQLQLGLLQLTDATTAARLFKQFGKDIRYIAPWKKWIVWNDAHWEADSGALIHTKGLEIVRNIYAEIYKTADYRERMEIEKYAIKSESTRQRENFVRAARYILELNAAVDDLDRDPWLLNVENGTIDLRTGELLPHRQEDMITKIAKVHFDRNAECPKWKQFIREIMGYKGDLIAFLQTAAGWAVSGDIGEQSMFILYGTGANGKSTFLNVLMHILGDYAITTYAETFMKRSNETLTNDIARLRGTRFVTTTETEQGKRLSEHLIKQATGNDQLTARFLYGEHFNFLPTFKIFMASNHKPVIKGTDHGVWRRIKLIPFTTLITEEKMDKCLEKKTVGGKVRNTELAD